MADADVDGAVVFVVGPDHGVVAHGFVLVVGGFIDVGEDGDVFVEARGFVEFVPLVGDFHFVGEAFGDGGVVVFDDHGGFLVGGVRGVVDAAHEVVEPLPVGAAAVVEAAGETGGVDADPAPWPDSTNFWMAIWPSAGMSKGACWSMMNSS